MMDARQGFPTSKKSTSFPEKYPSSESSRQHDDESCNENACTEDMSSIISAPPEEIRGMLLNAIVTNDSDQESNRLCEYLEHKSVHCGNKSQCNRIEVTSSTKVDQNMCDTELASKHCSQGCLKMGVHTDSKGSNIDVNIPSTSGLNKSISDNISESSGIKENRKRPSSLKLNRPDLDDDSSSDTGNDDYSLGSEDGCIYTYRGGEHLADLPSSFFSLDMGLPLDNHLPVPPNYPAPAPAREGSRASSPDMDFLEMDFDPGPSCEADTGDESTPDAELDAVSNMPVENEPLLRGTTPEYVAGPRQNPQPPNIVHLPDVHFNNVPSTSRGIEDSMQEEARSSQAYGRHITHINARGEQLLVLRTMSNRSLAVPGTLHISSGDLFSPREILNYEEEHKDGTFAYQINQGENSTSNLSSLYHLTMAKRLNAEKKISGNDKPESPLPEHMDDDEDAKCAEVPTCMVWSKREACERQVTQIGTSACGATAVINVFIALGIPLNVDNINAAVGTRQRANNAPIPRYLLSRAVAGCTAADIVTGIQRASQGTVTARFFHTHPERAVSLSHWLSDWISLGAVPILTLNLQVGCDGEIPDAWHHQMVFGVSPRGIYLCNPVECVREEELWPRLTSPSVLLVRARDIVSRVVPTMDLTPLMQVPDKRFHTFNVLGQVVNVIREWRAHGWSEQGCRTRHVRLPANYQAGVTVAALTGSEAHRRLMHAPPLPLLNAHPHTHSLVTLSSRRVHALLTKDEENVAYNLISKLWTPDIKRFVHNYTRSVFLFTLHSESSVFLEY